MPRQHRKERWYHPATHDSGIADSIVSEAVFLRRLASQEFSANPAWILAQIQYRIHLYCCFSKVVVDSEREPIGQHSVKSEIHFVNAMKQP